MLQQATALRIHEASAVAGVTDATINNWIAAGELEAKKHGRFRLVTRSSLQKKIASRAPVDTRKSTSRSAHERYSATKGDGHANPGSDRHIKMAALAREVLERSLEFRREALKKLGPEKDDKRTRTERNSLAAEIAMHKLTGVMSAYLTEAECRAFDHESDELDRVEWKDL